MDNNNPQIEHKDVPIMESTREGMVHFILSHSYTVFLLAVVFGVILDMIFPTNIFHGVVYQYIGLFMIVFGSYVIYWAQYTSNCTKEEMEKKGIIRDFARGPYKYSRNPTHAGLSIMTMGLGFIIYSVFSVALVFAAFIITKLIFVKEEEVILEKKYGELYCDYKNKVRTWL